MLNMSENYYAKNFENKQKPPEVSLTALWSCAIKPLLRVGLSGAGLKHSLLMCTGYV